MLKALSCFSDSAWAGECTGRRHRSTALLLGVQEHLPGGSLVPRGLTATPGQDGV